MSEPGPGLLTDAAKLPALRFLGTIMDPLPESRV